MQLKNNMPPIEWMPILNKGISSIITVFISPVIKHAIKIITHCLEVPEVPTYNKGFATFS